MQNLLLGLPDALPGLRGILVDFDMAVQAEGRDVSDISVDCRTVSYLARHVGGEEDAEQVLGYADVSVDVRPLEL
jgi:hypothetical protein